MNEKNEKKTEELKDSSTPIVSSYSVCSGTLTKGHLESFTARTNEKHERNTLALEDDGMEQ